MTYQLDIQMLLQEYGSILLLMFSAFLVGYFSSYFLNKKKYENSPNNKHKKKELYDIETIFTEIKPKIVDIIRDSQQKKVTEDLTNSSTEQKNTPYVPYDTNKPKLSLEKIGEGNKRKPDNLTKIEGIGPYIEEQLNNLGIYNFEQISKLEINDIRMITELIDFFPDRIEKDKWVEQAKSLLKS